MQNSGGGMAGGDELVRVARNENATLKFLPQNIVPGQYYLYMHLEKKNTYYIFSRKEFLVEKKIRTFFLF